MIPAREPPHLGILRLPPESPLPSLLRRAGLAVGLVMLVAVMLWLTRGGLRDQAHPGQALDFIDVLYFTVVSLTTVGYGDIVPVTDTARLINAVLLTPIRIFLFILFLGTAYELALLRFGLVEDYRMRRLTERLAGHSIICGFGVKGRTIADELIAHGHQAENIVVIDQNEEAVTAAAELGLVALRGDASAEALLRAAVIEKAAYVLVAPNRDDACVLICLTVRNLAPHVYLVASVREEENIKLVYRAGANLVVTPSVSGGRLMAATVRQHAVPQFLEDLLRFGQGIDMVERAVRPEEAGRTVSDLPDLAGALVLGVVRGEERCPFYRLTDWRLQPGDVVVYLKGDATCESSPA